MKNIVPFFLLFLLAVPLEAGQPRPVETQDIPADEVRKLNDVDGVLHTVFRLRKRMLRGCPLLIRKGRTTHPVLTAAGDRMTLTLPEKSRFPEDASIRRAAVSALLLSAGTRRLHANAEKALPDWLCAALVEKAESARHSERFFRRVTPVPVAAAAYDAGRMPDLSELPGLPPDREETVRIWYGEFSRLLLEAAVELKIAPAFAEGLFKTADYEKNVKSFERELLPSLKAPLTEKLLWSSFSPEPASRKLLFLEKMLKWEMQKVDKEGSPQEGVVSCLITELPRHLADRPDAAEQKQLAAQRLLALRSGCTYPEADDLQQMAYVIGNLPGDADAVSARLNSLLADLKKKLTGRDRLEKYLFEAESRTVSAARILKHSLRAGETGDTASPEQKRFLLDVEKTYTD